MHGRLKIRSSAEEAAIKKKEHERKVISYRSTMTHILEKRQYNEYDKEMMDLTAALLSKNPDISTLWNIRRQCILIQYRNVPDPDAKDNDNNGKYDDVKNLELFNKDLDFTENCLQINPKSYCAWHHRCWILETTKIPNWKREVDLCTKYLKLDERNFHCWDYRRYVVAKANIPQNKELDFCTERIQNNFSNYSSWHYRSKLLPILYPHEADKSRPINEDVLRNELEMVLTAAFTDPNDSSAWFYQRWLLGYSQQALDLIAFKLTKTYAIMTFSQPINLNSSKCVLTLDNNILENKNWYSINKQKYDTMWIVKDSFEFNNRNVDCIYELEFTGENNDKHLLTVTKYCDHLFGIKMPKFGYEFGAAVVEELKNQLNLCNQLLAIEPESKLANLTILLLYKNMFRVVQHGVFDDDV